MLDLPQTHLEPLLLNHAARRGASVAFNTEYRSHKQDSEGVTVELLDRLSGRTTMVRAKYLVGADGARSRVVEDLGLHIEGHHARAGTMYVLFTADLARYAAHRPSILYWIATASASFGEIGQGVLRAIRPWNQWIAGWGFDLADGEPQLSEGQIIERIRALVGDPELQPTIDMTSIWYVNQAWAPEYARGRVFCGGDAVHRHPPSSGLGSNTCLQDAHNLAWKLAYVIQGHAGPELLDSYSLERAPVGAQVVARANQSRLDYAPLNACFRDPDADASPEYWARDPQLHAQPTTRPGAKLPHAWLVNEQGRRVSTLDITGKGRFSLITGLSGRAWIDAGRALDLPFLRLMVIGEPGALDPYLHWVRVREMAEAGALLVRPDGVIAWRQCEPVYDAIDAERQLSAALAHILARSDLSPRA